VVDLEQQGLVGLDDEGTVGHASVSGRVVRGMAPDGAGLFTVTPEADRAFRAGQAPDIGVSVCANVALQVLR
jgi:hypothetical protein